MPTAHHVVSRDCTYFCSVVIVDEIDLLLNKSQNILYNFFDWPNRPNSSLLLIAIANTMDLPERIFNNKVSSRLGLHRIDFSPYTHQALTDILLEKLSTFQFQKDAIELCSRKVGAVSGDVRQAISFCDRAKQIAIKKCSSIVTLEDAHQAIQEVLASDRKSPLQGLSFHSLLFLISAYKSLRAEQASKSTKIEQVSLSCTLEKVCTIS